MNLTYNVIIFLMHSLFFSFDSTVDATLTKFGFVFCWNMLLLKFDQSHNDSETECLRLNNLFFNRRIVQIAIKCEFFFFIAKKRKHQMSVWSHLGICLQAIVHAISSLFLLNFLIINYTNHSPSKTHTHFMIVQRTVCSVHGPYTHRCRV